jgi:hypothetical protein
VKKNILKQNERENSLYYVFIFALKRNKKCSSETKRKEKYEWEMKRNEKYRTEQEYTKAK